MSDQLDMNNIVISNLLFIYSEMENQKSIGKYYSPGELSFQESMKQIHEFIVHSECEFAYEEIVCYLENFPFVLSGKAAVKLMEVGFLMRVESK